ncbi:MAG TPA: TonB-dependent receptor [Brumimicrobium sp.]|nr:TonB-dependent receptor [Brumimicrobium sp.]
MNRRSFYITLFLLLAQLTAFAQLDSIQKLPEVVLSDARLVNFSKGFKVENLNDSVVKRNSNSLTEVLRYNSSIYLKENGYGMVSSPSFRGTNAAQTAVIWNGININSIFTGQADFNILSPLNYDKISIRSGGGGVQYGSGAVGGSVHLNNNFSFHEDDVTNLGLRYGSFGTFGGNISTTQTWENHYLNVGVDFVSSENDYEYIGKKNKNHHAEFLRFTARINEARKLKRGVATWNSEYSYNDRNFSGGLNTIGRDGYKDVNTRNLLQLSQKYGHVGTTLKAAHLFEQFRYYPDSEGYDYSQGRANTFIGGFESEVLLNRKLRLNAKVEYTQIEAQGENIGNQNRKTLAAVLLMNHKPLKNVSYGVNIRQEFLNDFDNPLLFSVDAKWDVSRIYALRLNGSKNFRVPTFNDLYWYAGGNFVLKPETSYQVELGQEFKIKDLNIDLAAYYISSRNLIKWIPTSGTIWRPSNISKSENFGLEAKVDYKVRLGKEHWLKLIGLYSYTEAKDLDKDKQLIYVPYHKGSASLNYQYRSVSAFIQGVYTGSAYTTTDNTDTVDSSKVFNLGVDYSFASKPNVTIGGKVNNVFNVYYENVAYRPMPSRYFEIFLNFNI